MGTGYTRNDTPNNIADGNVINASDLDGEFDAIQSAFNGSTGHSHDGTTGEGPQIATAGLANGAVTSAKLDTNIQIAGTLGVTGETTLTTHLNMGDNDIIKLGASADLQIYHDGSKSIIHDNGAGQLLVRTNQFNVNNADNTEKLIEAIENAQVDLYYNNLPKLATTATGIDVTGTATMDGLTVDKTDTATYSSTAVDDTLVITRKNSSGTNNQVVGIKLDVTQASGVTTGVAAISAVQPTSANSADLVFQTRNSGTFGERMRIDSGGDISFYEDTGTTPKLFWDASAESLGIGTSSPSAGLQIVGSFGNQIKFGTNTSVYTDLSMGTGFTVFNSVGGDSGAFDFRDDGTSRMFINSSGNVGIGTSSPDYNLQVEDTSSNISLALTSSTTGFSRVIFGDSGSATIGAVTYRNSDNSMAFEVNASEAMRIDNSGNVGIGTSSPTNTLQVTGNIYASTTIRGNGGNSASSPNIAIDGGTGMFKPTGNTFAVSTNGTERMRIDGGSVLIGITTNPVAQSGTTLGGHFFSLNSYSAFSRVDGVVSYFNRQNSDGSILEFRQNGTAEGSISVSGTTVSYNGGHLSRWSQLTDNTLDNTIVKGTVMTNLDQMAEWTTDGVTEDNEQLNCMAVSSVEGDANVAGVFVNWDNDDDIYTNDMNIAMTGDMVIRIAQGTTVARGDLLMSAGDGTAKPQGDDIVRSKTIAKVTSTNVSHTYDDGTYLVPCVLMAC